MSWALSSSGVLVLTIFGVSISESTTSWSECTHRWATQTGGVNGMTVNLNVSCDRNGALLDWNSGGLAVTSIRLAKHCAYQNESTYQWEKIRSDSTNPQDSGGQLYDVTPVPSLPGIALECHYSGCYVGAGAPVYVSRYYFTFSTATCTFSQVVQATSTLDIIPSSSTSTGHSDGYGATSTLEFTPFLSTLSGHTDEYGAASSVVQTEHPAFLYAPSTPTPSVSLSSNIIVKQTPIGTSADHSVTTSAPGSVEDDVPPLTIMVVVAVCTVLVSVTLFTICLLIFARRFCPTTYQIKDIVYHQNDIFDVKFTPVHFVKPFVPSALSDFSIATKLDELCLGDRRFSFNTDLREKTDLDQTCDDQDVQPLSDSELTLAEQDIEDGTEQLDNQSEAQDDETSTSQRSFYVPHQGHSSGGYVPNVAGISFADPHIVFNSEANNYPDHHHEDDLDGESLTDLLDGALELVGDSAMTKDTTFTESCDSVPHVLIPASDEISKGTLQTINGYIPKNVPEMGRKWAEHEHDEFTLQLDDNDVTQGVPDEEQIHTTGSSYWTDGYLDNIMKQQQSQISDLSEMGGNWPDHNHTEFSLKMDDHDVTQDVPDEDATDSSYWSEAYLDMKQQQTQMRRVTYCATGYVSNVHNA